MSTIQDKVASANRLHIAIFGTMNVGKSSLLNAMTGQTVSIVSDKAGTTTDIVKKTMEIAGIGPCVWIDTAGFDDTTEIGHLRIAATEKAFEQCDVAIVVFSLNDSAFEKKWIQKMKEHKIPLLGVLSKIDRFSLEQKEERIAQLEKEYQIPVVGFSSVSKEGLDISIQELKNLTSGSRNVRHVLAGLVKKGDTVVLVMPQDEQAPQGRLIQPEVQTIRDALDQDMIAICITPSQLENTLHLLKKEPDLVITDSQVFSEVFRILPHNIRLTSFSVLMAALKGDIDYLTSSVQTIKELHAGSKVLIAECCTHRPLEEDIGRVKIPMLLHKKINSEIQIEVKAGTDFPENASDYDLIIQCGGCMFNRRYILERISKAKEQKVPMTNYGIAIAYLNGILDNIVIPESEEIYDGN